MGPEFNPGSLPSCSNFALLLPSSILVENHLTVGDV
jgi:hypothetical protein